MATHKTFCRFCHAFCGIGVDIEDNRVVAVRGDRDHPLSQGFTCIKGRQLVEQHNDPGRLRNTLRRNPEGRLEAIPSEQAMDEVAAALKRIIEQHGPRSVALYNGTKSWASVTFEMARSWLVGIGSPSFYTTVTIDQPAKAMAMALHGYWKAGWHRVIDSDVVMFVGTNPLQSYLVEAVKVPCTNASAYLRDCVRRGLKVIVIDPRRTETAQYAAMHLQVRPGEDPTLLAGLVRVILAEELYDKEFVALNARGLDALREAVDPFTLDYVERRAGVAAKDVAATARLFAAGPRGSVVAGTGPNMAPHPLSTEMLVNLLNTLCGRYAREGEYVNNAGVLGAPHTPRAEAGDPFNFWEGIDQPRVRGLRSLNFQQPTAALADEILTPGEGQIRAFICNGGNPAVAFPNQAKVVRALKSLDLLVVLDVIMSPTAKLADYVFGCKLSLEKPDYSRHLEWYFTDTFAQYTPAFIQPGFDVIEEWEFFWGMAHRMRVPLTLGRSPLGPPVRGRSVDIDRKPAIEELMEIEAADARIALERVRQYPSGHVFEDARVQVAARDPAMAGHFDLAPPHFLEDLRRVLNEPIVAGGGYSERESFTHRLISRRMREVFNSTGVHLAALNSKGPGNPAYMNPDDMHEGGIRNGDLVRIESANGAIIGVARAEAGLRRGVISMAHSWGDLPGGDDAVAPPETGGCTNRLIADDSDFEPLVGQCRQSAIPVNVCRAAALHAGGKQTSPSMMGSLDAADKV
ncbi:MAG TPA: molybdopterin-dependent oxidoreductase [Candidatus Binataceae bacterium]|nr:molybdopterin-dependent oxidoreductase [Candidatus Binataceae bacterium]